MQNLVKQWAPFSKKSGSVHSLCITSPIDKSDEVKVVERKDSKTKILRLRVAEEDLGKVIDKQGEKAHSIRTILNATATKLKQTGVLEIIG